MASLYDDRIDACRHELEATDAALAVVFPGPNLTYLTGFQESPSERHFLCFVPREGDPTVVAPSLYESQLAALPVDGLTVRTWSDDDDPVAVVADILQSYGIETGRGRTILLDDRLWETFSQDVRSLCPGADFGLASTALEPLRLRKDAVERQALAEASAIADEVSLEIRKRGTDLVGTTEAELAAEIERHLADAGGVEPAFETIVASGPNAARPHHHSGDREIQHGDPIVLDFGAFVDAELPAGAGRYPGDQTRTIVVGDPPAGYTAVHDTVCEAQQAAIGVIEPGVSAAAVDRAARDVIETAGYGEAFRHRTGHGVGLEVHEPPYLVADNDRELEPGMVFSVEPGIYLDDRFGVRIEDLVVVTEDGSQRLNDSPRGWETET
ncbi:aminopeptidase P family protein [Salinadaptatus halalkaliphilus]|uniref:Aminopeptidase P family protein n=1 Tax=Salinadaptatus halalkaliphilus TaxID=2419781 RepID=A0A4S3TPD6_9EURY|nr:Xaa-Pro peptidase family protein [Salinadaptatus halalkaliphilus]THE66182.1 aminopeptidase P family protein [Salinadaptatus halalkaliphilus]